MEEDDRRIPGEAHRDVEAATNATRIRRHFSPGRVAQRETIEQAIRDPARVLEVSQIGSGPSFNVRSCRPCAGRATMPPCVRRGADQHAFGGIACRSRRGRSAVLAMVTPANQDYAVVAAGCRRIPGRVRSCDNASSGACGVRAAISHPGSGGSGLYAPPRGHDQGRVGGRWPRGAPVPLARLEE